MESFLSDYIGIKIMERRLFPLTFAFVKISFLLSTKSWMHDYCCTVVMLFVCGDNNPRRYKHESFHLPCLTEGSSLTRGTGNVALGVPSMRRNRRTIFPGSVSELSRNFLGSSRFSFARAFSNFLVSWISMGGRLSAQIHLKELKGMSLRFDWIVRMLSH